MRCPRNCKHLLVATCLWLVPVTMSFTQDSAPSLQEETTRLIGVLASDATVFDKAQACRRLAVVGDRSAASALAPLLADEQLATYARSALEAIPGREADAALRRAVKRLQGDLLVGVLGSIGKRGDAEAVPALIGLLAGDDKAVAAAAARALGHIANAPAARGLQEALAEAPPQLRPAVGSACLLCAQNLLRHGSKLQAVALMDRVETADLPQHIRLAAAYNAIIALNEEEFPRLRGQLDSEDPSRFRMALQAARKLGAKASGTLAARLEKSPVERKELLIIALADIGDTATVPAIIKAARSGEKPVRVQAIRALGRLGHPSAVTVLLDAAVEEDAEVAGAARSALAAVDSRRIDAAIAEMLDSQDPEVLQTAVALAGRRGIAAATPALLRLAVDAQPAVRQAAVKSLGSTVELSDLPKLIHLAIVPGKADLQSMAQDALRGACARLPREACAGRLAGAMSGAPAAAKVLLLEQLTAIGGTTALETVVAAARSGDDALQDGATRLLGRWPTADAAPALFDLAKTLENNTYKIRTLRGYVRIARQLDMTADQRMTVCRNTLAVAGRDEEKMLVLEVLERYPTAEGLGMAASLLDEQGVGRRACSAVVSMAGAVALRAPQQTEKALRRVLELAADDGALRQEAKRQLAAAEELVRQSREEGEFTPLFDGVSLRGWECTPGVFRVDRGAIVGGDLNKAIGTGNDFACTKRQFGDFELRLQFKLIGAQVNGGVNLRSKRSPQTGVAAGYQADLGQTYWGCLYDEARRNRMLAHAGPKPTIKAGDFNDYRIRCEGKRIRLWVGGVLTVDYTEQDPNISTRGIIALQVQANRPGEARYRNVRIKEL